MPARSRTRGGLRVVAQSTGHGAAALGDLEDALLIKTDRLTGVTVHTTGRRARVAAGARWRDVIDATAATRLVALHGSSAQIGVAGYSLNGGIGWYGRKLGLQANSVTSIELVTASGEMVRADAEREPDLFWALRGGGGAFGVVTDMEFALHRVGDVTAGALFFPVDRAPEVLHAWRAWTADVPDEVTSLGRLLRVPDMPAAPPHLRGRSFALIEAVIVGPAAGAAELIAPLRRLGADMDTFATVAPSAVPALHMDPRDHVAYQRGDVLLSELTADAVDRMIEHAGPGASTPLVSVELRHLGGALGRGSADHGALSAIDGSALVVAIGMHRDPAGHDAVRSRLDSLSSALSPLAAPTRTANFVETPADFSTFFDDATARRLRRIKDAVDPEGLILASHGGETAPGARIAMH
jgi:FAD/FMN-containing dehydrogenase